MIVPKDKGVMDAVQPSTKKILKILDPITLPRHISECPLVAATIDVANSGRDVPAASIVSPISPSDHPMARAIADALSTNHCPPSIRQARPPNVTSKARHRGIGGLALLSSRLAEGLFLADAIV